MSRMPYSRERFNDGRNLEPVGGDRGGCFQWVSGGGFVWGLTLLERDCMIVRHEAGFSDETRGIPHYVLLQFVFEIYRALRDTVVPTARS